MIQSMTGFGASEKDGFRVEIRSLNHRFMEISIKITTGFNGHEMLLRNMLKERFSRGKFDILIAIKGGEKISLKPNTLLAKEICNSLNALKSELSLQGTIGIDTLLNNYKELLITEEPEYDTSSLNEAFRDAMAQLETMRVDEGRALAQDLTQRAERLESMLREILSLRPEVISDCRMRFHERLQSLLGSVEFDRERIEQEIVIMIEKSDITEELTRIENHLKHLRKILSNGDTIGKRLDFLLQELNREVNTIAAKTAAHRILDITIDMKVEIEKMREQAQNIQ